MKTCSIDGCNTRAASRGWCRKHYDRWRAHGDPHFVKQIRNNDPVRFASKYTVDASTGCWVWHGVYDKRGYGRFDSGYRPLKAHRFAYELLVGPIPDGKEIDHLCRNTSCVNPEHLEPVTQQENLRRAVAARRVSAQQ